MLLPPIGISAAMKFYGNGNVDVYAGLYLATMFTLFATIFSKYNIYMNNNLLKKIFGIVIILSGVYIYFSPL